MANLMEMSQAARAKVKKSDFIFPDRDPPAYPIPDEKHAVDALTFARWPNNKKDFKEVFAAVKKRYPAVAKRFMGGKFAKSESITFGDDPVLRERLESIGLLISEADSMSDPDPNSVAGMFVQEMCASKGNGKSKGKKKG